MKHWITEYFEHIDFVESINLYVCKCLDDGQTVEGIKKFLTTVVDVEVEKLERVTKRKVKWR